MSETKQHPVDHAKPRKKTWLVVLGILIVAVGVILLILGWWWFVQPAFVINGHKYSKSTYFNMMAAAKKNGVGQKEATVKYIDIEKRRIAADQLKITPSVFSQSAIAAGLYKTSLLDKLDAWQKEVVYGESITPALTAEQVGGYQGSYFNFPFSKNFQALSYYQTSGQSPKPEGYGNPTAIEDDKKYAKEKLDNYYKVIKEGGSEQQVVEKLRNDPRLDLGSASNGSNTFNTDKNGLQLISDSLQVNWKNKIDPKLFKGKESVGISDVQIRKVQAWALEGKPIIDGSYYFVKFNSYSDGNPNIITEFDTIVEGLKVEKNV